MSSVPKRRSVIDLVDDWFLFRCRNPECGRGIDVQWFRQDGDPTFSWADDETLMGHCPECLVNKAPDDDKPSVASFYDRIRAVRRDIGHGESEAPRVTLVVTKWHLPPTSEGRRRDDPDDPYMEEFSILGHIPHPEGQPPDFKRLSPFPLFRAWLLEPPILIPTPAGKLLFRTPAMTPVLVHLALYAFHPKVPAAHRRFVWDPSDPTREYPLLTHGWYGIPARQLHEFEKETLKLFEAACGRRSGTGNYSPDEGHIFLEDVERVIARAEADGIRITNMDMLIGKVGTLGKTQFNEMLHRVPEARERYRQHKRKPPR